MSKDELEGQFVDLLGHLTLKPEYLRLFHETVVHAWHGRLALASHDARAQERRLTDLRAKRDRLEAAYVFEQKVDAGTYKRQKEKLDQEIISAEMAERESRLEELDGLTYRNGRLGTAETPVLLRLLRAVQSPETDKG